MSFPVKATRKGRLWRWTRVFACTEPISVEITGIVSGGNPGRGRREFLSQSLIYRRMREQEEQEEEEEEEEWCLKI